jgi:hypothetical protein
MLYSQTDCQTEWKYRCLLSLQTEYPLLQSGYRSRGIPLFLCVLSLSPAQPRPPPLHLLLSLT